MIFIPALEAEAYSTVAWYGVFHAEVILLNNVVAILLWTPLNILIMIRKLLAVPKVVLFSVVNTIFEHFIGDVFKEHRVRYHHIASQLWTFGEHAPCSHFGHFTSQVLSPTCWMVLMLAHEGLGFPILIRVVEFAKANSAHSIVIFWKRGSDVLVFFV